MACSLPTGVVFGAVLLSTQWGALSVRESRGLEHVALDRDTTEELDIVSMEAFLAGDAPLFGRYRKFFRGVEAALLDDPGSVLSRLSKALGTAGEKTVLVGAGGAGKTESTLLAMEIKEKSKLNFNLRSWFLKQRTDIAKKDYNKGYDEEGYSQIKADQLALLKERKEEVEEGMKDPDPKQVLFFDEMDLSQSGFLNKEELDTVEFILNSGKEVAGAKSKVLVLHPLAAVQAEVLELLKRFGYPEPGSSNWIDFSTPYSEAVEVEVLRAVLGENCTTAWKDVMDYFLGLPGAYLPILQFAPEYSNPYADCSANVNHMKEAAVAKLGGKLMFINVGISTTEGSKEKIAALLQNPNADLGAGTDVSLAVSSMAFVVRDGRPVVPPVIRDAFKLYKEQNRGAACVKKLGEAICSVQL